MTLSLLAACNNSKTAEPSVTTAASDSITMAQELPLTYRFFADEGVALGWLQHQQLTPLRTRG